MTTRTDMAPLQPTGDYLACVHCRRFLPLDAFRENPKLRTGYNSWCKSCFVERTRQWRATNADAINARRRLAYVSVKGR